ncbi:MAG TPA: hypothetical protein VFD58_26340 [Blastocatellia bacterium]|nr:hypothetical protein [Blastocatellia bacterium]
MSFLDLRRGKRLSKFIVGCLGGSAVSFVAISQIARFIATHPSDSYTHWIAAVPFVWLMLVAVIAMRSLRGMDELERRMHTEAMAFAFLASLLLISSCGFFALEGLMKLSLSWIAPVMVGSWIVGLVIAIWRYR